MPFQLYILDPRGRLSSEQFSAIEDGVHEGVRRLQRHVALERIVLVVQLADFASYCGRAYGPDSATLWFNPDHFQTDETTYLNVAHLVVHELHHVVRWASLTHTSDDGWTPGEVLALEGLATQCELFLGFPLSHAVRDLTDDLVDPLLTRIAPHIGNGYLDHLWIDEPLCGPGHPHRAASAMGHVLCQRFLERSGETPMSAIQTPWQEIWQIGAPKN